VLLYGDHDKKEILNLCMTVVINERLELDM